ncbi:endoglucanase 2-like protein [Tanacetum coccineum]
MTSQQGSFRLEASNGVTQRYSDALGISTQFFDVQKSGRLENNLIKWRGDSGLEDGKDEKVDLSKGLYDAGDLMKFGFPMAFTATILAWSILEYGHHMDEVKELKHAQESLKWITDYLVNAHPSDNVLYIQVGGVGGDQTLTTNAGKGPKPQQKKDQPFKSTPHIRDQTLQPRLQQQWQQPLSVAIPPPKTDTTSLRDCTCIGTCFANWGNPHVLGIRSCPRHRQLLPPVHSQKTNGGLIWVNEWDTLQYSIATSFLAVVFSDYMFTSNTPYIYCNGKLFEPINLREFAISQPLSLKFENFLKAIACVCLFSDLLRPIMLEEEMDAVEVVTVIMRNGFYIGELKKQMHVKM